MTFREPLGVVGLITPWNFPLAIPTWKIAPALAYGNTVVLKPADLVPGSAWALVDILHRAGTPPGVLNLVMGRGSKVGEAILESEEGFHIVRVLERKEAGRKPFTEVQGEIRERLKEQRFHEGVDQYLAKLRREARIWTAFSGNTSADVLLGRRPEETQRR
jgi:hypothetical protein